MRIESAFLANAAEVQGSLVYALGAFPEWWWVKSVPSVQRFKLVLVLLAETDDDENGTKWNVQVAGPTTPPKLVARINALRGPDEDWSGDAPRYVTVAIDVEIEFRETGVHTVHIDGPETKTIRLAVRTWGT